MKSFPFGLNSQQSARGADMIAGLRTAAGADRLAVRLAGAQGAYYLLTGIWPLIAGNSFQRVTGPKRDFWVAQTVGALLTVSGLVLLKTACGNRVIPDVAMLGGGQAAVLGAVDILCVRQPRTTPAYLLEAPVEFLLAGAWLLVGSRRRTRSLLHSGKVRTPSTVR